MTWVRIPYQGLTFNANNNKMKQSHVQISDTPKGHFRVTIIGKNGEKISQSEALESPLAVLKNIAASSKAFGRFGSPKSIKSYVDYFDYHSIKVVYIGKKTVFPIAFQK